MEYLLTLYEDETLFTRLNEEDMDTLMASYFHYTEELQKAGAFISGEPLEPSNTGAIIQSKDGKTQIQDGPFTDIKEQMGGFYLIKADNLDIALDWAAKCPCAKTGTVEVRPVWNITG